MGAGLKTFFCQKPLPLNRAHASPRDHVPRTRPPPPEKHASTQTPNVSGAAGSPPSPRNVWRRFNVGGWCRALEHAELKWGGGVDFLFWGGRGSQGYTKGMHRVQYTHRGTHVHTRGYTDVQRGPRGTRGYTWVHGGTQGHTGVHMGAQGLHTGTQGVHKGYCTQGRGTVHRGTVLYTGVLYTGVHRGTQGYTGVHRGVHTQGCSEAHRQKPLSDCTVRLSDCQSGKRHQLGRFFSLNFFADFGRILDYLPLRTLVHRRGSKP
jgi:hypothetical protein